MTDYVPVSEVRRLAHSAEAYAGVFPDDTDAKRLGNKLAEEIRECAEEQAITESEVCEDA